MMNRIRKIPYINNIRYDFIELERQRILADNEKQKINIRVAQLNDIVKDYRGKIKDLTKLIQNTTATIAERETKFQAAQNKENTQLSLKQAKFFF